MNTSVNNAFAHKSIHKYKYSSHDSSLFERHFCTSVSMVWRHTTHAHTHIFIHINDLYASVNTHQFTRIFFHLSEHFLYICVSGIIKKKKNNRYSFTYMNSPYINIQINIYTCVYSSSYHDLSLFERIPFVHLYLSCGHMLPQCLCLRTCLLYLRLLPMYHQPNKKGHILLCDICM